MVSCASTQAASAHLLTLSVEREPGHLPSSETAPPNQMQSSVFPREAANNKRYRGALARNLYLVGSETHNLYLVGSETEGMENSFPFLKLLRGETRTDLGS
jgi:hypothetical protein